jgi:hypothetical protein
VKGKTAEHGLRRRLVFLVVSTAAVLAIAQAAHAHGDDHHAVNGNQGSVKVDGDEIDDGPANHPHVICAVRIVVEHGVGAPFDIDFDAQAPTTRAGADQHLLIVHVPAGDGVTGLIDLRGFVAGIVPNPQQGFHIFITVHLPGGDKHKVIWVLKDCPSPTTSTVVAGGTTTTVKKGTTTTTVKSSASITPTTVVGSVLSTTTNSTVPTQVLGESFTKNPAAAAAGPTSLANTGMPFPPGVAVALLVCGLLVLGGARHVSGRRLELSMRRVDDRER